MRRHVGVPYRFESVKQVVKFVLIAALGSIIAPSIALLPLALLYQMPLGELLGNWSTWWQGDACGVLIFAPLILSWCARSTVAWTPRKLVEAALFGVLLLGAAHVVFSTGFARTFLLVPFIVWAAFRFGQREVTTVVAVVCAMALWYMHPDRGPSAAPAVHESLLLLLPFVSTLVFTGLVLSAVLSQLERAMAELESRVRGRTAELEEAKSTAEKASEAKSQFLANMSHELRTPLNSLLILARLLADNPGGNLNPKQVKFAQTIHASGLDLLALINDLLDLAKIESGAVTALNVAPARFDELREDLERTFRQLAHEKSLQFAITVDPALPPTVRTDAGRLKQVLKNLLANAFKFTSRGAVTLRIAPDAPGHVAFSVSDTGIGIAPDKQQLIFEAFRQADGTTSRQYGGTGLGLSISRELTRLLGGELRLSSVPGQGSTFTLVLPLADQRAAVSA
jgi:signal transduction histidine kinase